MSPEEFVDELDRRVRDRLGTLSERAAVAQPQPSLSIADLLAVALKKELEASEEAALWMTSETDVDVKLSLARQCGDEAKHYRLIEARLRELGKDPTPLRADAARTPMFEYLCSLSTTVERVAAGQFTREALAKVQNEVFIQLCDERGDVETARLYRETIQPDEEHHHHAGRRLLLRLARSEDEQTRARAAAARTLEIAEELSEIARLRRGITRAPGC
jgi:uncharacterized ferritin-like protein (DUF455 family)